jgi:lipocalin-like protein
MKRASIGAGSLLLLWSLSSVAQEHHACAGPQLGTRKLQSFTTEYLETGQTTEPYGTHPTGYLSYGPDCRMYAIIVQENRKPPAAVVPTDAEKIELFGGVLAYAGTYTILLSGRLDGYRQLPADRASCRSSTARAGP